MATPFPRGTRPSVRAVLSAVAVAAVFTGCSDLDHGTGPAELPIPSMSLGAEGIPAISVSPDGRPYAAGHILVRFTPGAAAASVAQQNRGALQRELRLSRTWVVQVEPGTELEVAAQLARNPNVQIAEPDYATMVMPCGTGDCVGPDDSFFFYKWDLHNDGAITNLAGTLLGETGLAGADMDWLEAYNHLESTGGVAGSAVIGILDTGIRDTHIDLAGKVIGARNFAYLYDTSPSFGPGFVFDRNGHGTHVAGIAAATGSNGVGIPGVAWADNVKLLNAKVCEFYNFTDGTSGWSCFSSAQVNAIIWAVEQGANVLNLSLGGSPLATAGDPFVEAALDHARANNVLPFCASGNNGYGGGISFPARFASCVAVGATTWSDTRASYSNYAAEVELSAPGGSTNPLGTPYSYILAPYIPNPWNAAGNGSYVFMTGTSMATPQAAGLAGLLYALGETDADQVLARMKAGADDLGAPGHDPEFGHGRINVYRSITGAPAAIPFEVTARSVVNPRAAGRMQVTIGHRDAVTFSLGMVNLASIRLQGVPVAARPDGTLFASWSGAEGTSNLVLHFDVPALAASGALSAGTTALSLTGTLSDGRTIRGTVPVRVTP